MVLSAADVQRASMRARTALCVAVVIIAGMGWWKVGRRRHVDCGLPDPPSNGKFDHVMDTFSDGLGIQLRCDPGYVVRREQQIGGSGGSLEPPGPLS